MKYLFLILSFFITIFLYAQADIMQHVLFEEIKAKYEADVTNQCDTVKAHFNDKEAIGRISFLRSAKT